MSSSAAGDLDSSRNLIDALLEEQQRLTAVERFARHHERHELPSQARYYRSLIPLTRPGPGEQYAFAVDLDVCTACKACVSACHSLNGLDEDEIWRNVGTLHGGTRHDAYQQTVTTACHQCVEPGCLEGCPVMAYEKDESTGIVRHLDDQCIGCQYCVLKCPYDVPKYSAKRGIVRKCDMCYQRLAADEAPACVQACPNEAITIRLVQKSSAVANAVPGARLLPGAFESHYTKPTTSYVTRRAIPANAAPANAHRLHLEHAHWPLIWMLLFTQLSGGLTLCIAGISTLSTASKVAAPLAIAAFAVLQLGLAVSVLHLGKPMKAWRFFLGLRTSWMSREILAFSIFAGSSGTVAAVAAGLVPRIPLPLVSYGAAIIAAMSIACSAMIYVDTHRPAWVARVTFSKFFGTTLTLGLTAAAALLFWSVARDSPLGLTARIFEVGGLASLLAFYAWEANLFRSDLKDEDAPAHRAARSARQLLRPLILQREALMAASVAAGTIAFTFDGYPAAIGSTCLFLAAFLSALIERYCFFTASDAPRMPGGIS